MKKLVKDYSWEPGAGEIISPELIGLAIEQVLLIVNVTVNRILYNPTNFDLGGISLTNGVFGLRLPTDDSSVFQHTDQLQIWIDDGVSPARNDNLDSLLYLANAIAERMPMLDTLDRVQAVVSGAVTVSGNLTNVSGLATLNTLQNQPAAFAPYNWASGAYHIYQNIQVTTP